MKTSRVQTALSILKESVEDASVSALERGKTAERSEPE